MAVRIGCIMTRMKMSATTTTGNEELDMVPPPFRFGRKDLRR